nr:PREDICTED: F-box only protein 22-like [Bemisia tabaci]XP_018902765.1 PREDICTED: F-box only protein 22-like [Bemisia tabaci]
MDKKGKSKNSKQSNSGPKEKNNASKGKKNSKKQKTNKKNDEAVGDGASVADLSDNAESRNLAYVITHVDHRTFGEFLSQPTPIIFKILSYLPHGDLQNCARVCRNWQSLVPTILEKRFSYEWFYAGSSATDLKCLPERFAKFSQEIKIAPQLILGFEPTEAKFPTCSTCLALNRPDAEKQKGQKQERCRCIKNDFEKIYQSAFPKTPAGSFRITSYGVISSYLGQFHTLYTTEDNDFNQTTLLFPNCEGLEISSHLFRQVELNNLTKHALTKILTGHDHAVKAVLIYVTDSSLSNYSLMNNGYSLAKHTASILRQKQKTPAVSMGGGVVKKIRDTMKPNVSYQAAMFIFRGAKVSAYSTVIKEKEASEIATTIKNVSEKIKSMPGRKLCFMTECIDRQSLYVSDNMDLVCNLESRTLNRFLPGIPIFGFWSAGEIGFTTHDETLENEEGRVKVAHTFATSFLFLILED